MEKFLKMFCLSQKSNYIQKCWLNLWQMDFAGQFCLWPARLPQKEHSVSFSWSPLSLENLLFLSIFSILLTVSDFLYVFFPFYLYWLPAFSFVHVTAIYLPICKEKTNFKEVTQEGCIMQVSDWLEYFSPACQEIVVASSTLKWSNRE